MNLPDSKVRSMSYGSPWYIVLKCTLLPETLRSLAGMDLASGAPTTIASQFPSLLDIVNVHGIGSPSGVSDSIFHVPTGDVLAPAACAARANPTFSRRAKKNRLMPIRIDLMRLGENIESVEFVACVLYITVPLSDHLIAEPLGMKCGGVETFGGFKWFEFPVRSCVPSPCQECLNIRRSPGFVLLYRLKGLLQKHH